MVLNDYQRGKLPHYVPPPEDPNRQDSDEKDQEPVEEKEKEEEEEEKVQPKFKKDKKRKKTGSNFYETHNAKNRPRHSNDDNGAKKKQNR